MAGWLAFNLTSEQIEEQLKMKPAPKKQPAKPATPAQPSQASSLESVAGLAAPGMSVSSSRYQSTTTQKQTAPETLFSQEQSSSPSSNVPETLFSPEQSSIPSSNIKEDEYFEQKNQITQQLLSSGIPEDVTKLGLTKEYTSAVIEKSLGTGFEEQNIFARQYAQRSMPKDIKGTPIEPEYTNYVMQSIMETPGIDINQKFADLNKHYQEYQTNQFKLQQQLNLNETQKKNKSWTETTSNKLNLFIETSKAPKPLKDISKFFADLGVGAESSLRSTVSGTYDLFSGRSGFIMPAPIGFEKFSGFGKPSKTNAPSLSDMGLKGFNTLSVVDVGIEQFTSSPYKPATTFYSKHPAAAIGGIGTEIASFFGGGSLISKGGKAVEMNTKLAELSKSIGISKADIKLINKSAPLEERLTIKTVRPGVLSDELNVVSQKSDILKGIEVFKASQKRVYVPGKKMDILTTQKAYDEMVAPIKEATLIKKVDVKTFNANTIKMAESKSLERYIKTKPQGLFNKTIKTSEDKLLIKQTLYKTTGDFIEPASHVGGMTKIDETPIVGLNKTVTKRTENMFFGASTKTPITISSKFISKTKTRYIDSFGRATLTEPIFKVPKLDLRTNSEIKNYFKNISKVPETKAANLEGTKKFVDYTKKKTRTTDEINEAMEKLNKELGPSRETPYLNASDIYGPHGPTTSMSRSRKINKQIYDTYEEPLLFPTSNMGSSMISFSPVFAATKSNKFLSLNMNVFSEKMSESRINIAPTNVKSFTKTSDVIKFDNKIKGKSKTNLFSSQLDINKIKTPTFPGSKQRTRQIGMFGMSSIDIYSPRINTINRSSITFKTQQIERLGTIPLFSLKYKEAKSPTPFFPSLKTSKPPYFGDQPKSKKKKNDVMFLDFNKLIKSRKREFNLGDISEIMKKM
jgi:hypothetical protein